MSTSTTTTRTRVTTPATVVLFVLVALLTLLAAGPARALSVHQPQDDPTLQPSDGPTLQVPEDDPDPEGPDDFGVLEVAPTLIVVDQCNPDGFHYKMIHPDAPEGAIHQAQWREAPAGQVQALPFNQASGFVPSGEGDFQVRGVIVNQGEVFHSYDWVDVTVFCPDIELPPNGRTEVTIDVDPVCEPDAGLAYEIDVEGAPNGNLAHKAQWRELGGQVETVDGQSGTIATGEGTFEIRGILHYQGPGFYPSDWVEVTVDCTEEPGGDPDPEDPGDDPRPGTPTFTG